MMEAERLYGLVLHDPASPPAARPQAWERMITAAVSNGHTHSALQALELWRADTPGTDEGPVWQQLWNRAAERLDPLEAERRAQTLWLDARRPPVVRFNAAKRSLPSGNPILAGVLADAYEQTDQAGHAAMEGELLAALGYLPEPALLSLIGPQPGSDARFPWSVFLLETARRMAANPPPPSSGEEPADPLAPLLERLRRVSFADSSLPAILNQVAAVTGQQIPELSLPMPSVQELLADSVSFAPVCASLLLPLTGPYAELGAGVRAGATLAAEQMRRAGVDVTAHFIDTTRTDWTQQLAALPAHCVLVGGPMQPEAYDELRNRNLLSARAVFAFLARIAEGDEGGRAWRFFPAGADQILALQEFAARMGIRAFGIFHPDDAYGNAMAGEFAALAPTRGGTVTASLAYPADAPEQWPKLAGNFVGVRMVNKLPVPTASFQAVFLPDSWSSMDMAVSSLFYQGADSNLLMGTSLWEQNLSESPPVILNNMSLAVFPGMWNPRSLNVPARLLRGGLGPRKVDTWTALGYDFVRFASAMNLQPGWTQQTVNERLTYVRNMNWGMAPMDWNNGRARQMLFIMTPVAGGEPALVDPALFKQRFDTARLQSERRQARATGRKK
jgi:hypothetical protein